jgi:light-regulated signal transduction histidine kinase (bacteriophytochrome)
LNEHLSAHTTNLEAANKELEAFSYSVSHDLRAPLRHISGFVDLLSKHGSAGDDPKAARYLKFISGSAQQMGNLVDDLLSFSRMGRAEMRFTEISLQQLAGEIKDELAASYRGRSIDWDINSLPEVQADPAMMRQVVLNLFSNAVKYTGTRAAAKIEVGPLPSEAEHIVFVRDNGVGFDMKYSDKLFGVFQRLHHADEFEGTGIGLANVRRVIHRHGGRTWAEAVPDRGATFYFAIPKKPKPQASKTTS